VTLGNFASKLLLGTKDGITRLRGRSFPFGDAVLIPTFHPAAILRGGGDASRQMEAVRADFRAVKDALEDALQMAGPVPEEQLGLF
jgi:uracil-DNA glycosylase family 4